MAVSIPFKKGVNFSKWFESRTFNDIKFDTFTEQDFINVKKLGGDVIRLPIAFHRFLSDEKECKLEPGLFKYLDTVINWAEKHQIYLIMDNHSFHPINDTDINIDKILVPVWEQLAAHYKNRSSFLIYEILNEPHGIKNEDWNKIQIKTLEVIRKIDKSRLIVIGGTNYNSIEMMTKLPLYNDENIIYTFHFYDPHIFTHQGAVWNEPSLAPLAGLPFPLGSNKIPPIHETFKDTWVEQALLHYDHDSKLSSLTATLDKACFFAKEKNVSVFCGEFGVYMKQSPEKDRVFWYKFFCEELSKRNIPWTCWDYFGGFGLYKTQNRGEFPTDLNEEIVKAMGFSCF